MESVWNILFNWGKVVRDREGELILVRIQCGKTA